MDSGQVDLQPVSSTGLTRSKTLSKEGRRSALTSSIILPLYAMFRHQTIRRGLRSLVLRLEGGPVYSTGIREIFRRFHGVDVGLYTIGPCDVAPGNLAPGTTVGRYCSIYYTVRAVAGEPTGNTKFRQNYFPESALAPEGPGAGASSDLRIGNDVFIGHNAIILPSVKKIGDGAVIGAGSVVHADVPPYAVVTGNPSRVVRFRFSEEKIKELLESRWWLKSIDELAEEIDTFQKPLEGSGPVR